MLKRRDSPYLSGRPKGPWFKWKRGALTIDVVLMYAQRGHGKRSSFYSDYTFGAWRGDALVPVGKAYSGFTDDELRLLDKWVRDHTVKRYGPVREVAPGLVLEIAFDSVHRSTRHKSGVAMRFPRVHRIRWDKPFSEADTLENLEQLMTMMPFTPVSPFVISNDMIMTGATCTMPSSHTLGAHFEGFVKALVESGRYNNASEVLRDRSCACSRSARTCAKIKVAELRRLAEEGRLSGLSDEDSEAFRAGCVWNANMRRWPRPQRTATDGDAAQPSR